jgi:hypothetical protein
MKEYSGVVDQRVICSYKAFVELLPSRVDVSCEVVLNRGGIYATLALRKVIYNEKLARRRRNIAPR